MAVQHTAAQVQRCRIFGWTRVTKPSLSANQSPPKSSSRDLGRETFNAFLWNLIVRMDTFCVVSYVLRKGYINTRMLITCAFASSFF